MLIISGWATLIRELWKTPAVKQKVQPPSDKIEKINENVHALRTGDMDILQWIEDANIRFFGNKSRFPTFLEEYSMRKSNILNWWRKIFAVHDGHAS